MGVAGVARKVKMAYVGRAGAARLCWNGTPAVSTPTQSGTLTYNGSAQSPTWSGYDPDIMTIGRTTSATNAGTYTATFTLKSESGYRWKDGTTGEKSVSWSIDKKTARCVISPTASFMRPYVLAKGEQVTFYISCTGCDATNVTGDASFPVVSFSSTASEVVVSTGELVKSGTEGQVTIALEAWDNYKFIAAGFIFLKVK